MIAGKAYIHTALYLILFMGLSPVDAGGGGGSVRWKQKYAAENVSVEWRAVEERIVDNHIESPQKQN